MALPPEERVRTGNVVVLVKLETTPGVDAVPTFADAIPFEKDGYSFNSPYSREQSNEANGSNVAGAPLVIAKPAEISIKVRIKGAGGGAVYSSTVKPPHHVLLEACGLRGLFTAAIAAAPLTAGTVNSATLGTGFASTDASYLGMPLKLSVGPDAGRIVHVAGYSGAKVATLTDQLDAALTVGTSAELLPNWTYAGTSPKDSAARVADQPTATIYIYEDGTLHKFFGCRGKINDLGSDTAKPGYGTFNFMGVYGGKFDGTNPVVTVPGHSAPVLAMGTGSITPAFLVNRKELAVSKWGLNSDQQLESPDDPNTAYGFATAEIGGRTPVFSIDPLATLKATRDSLAEIEAGTAYPTVVRHGTVAGNRWSLTLPEALIAESQPGTRGLFRSEQVVLQALNPGVDAVDRDAEAILCFY